jgi:hypothetical protein
MKYFLNFCHGSRTVGFGTSAIFVKARLPALLFCRYVHILDHSSFRTAKSSGSLRPGRRISNYEAGGIGACSVGTYRKNFSVTFWQQRPKGKGIAPACRGDFEGRPTYGRGHVSRYLGAGIATADDARARNSRRRFGNIYAVRGTDTAISIRALVTR